MNPELLDQVLADFRSWWQQSAERGLLAVLPEGTGPELDLAGLLNHFLALRQEVNLQTRATRAQQEQNQQTLDTLAQALEKIEDKDSSLPPENSESAKETRAWLKILIETHDALDLARRELQKMQLNNTPVPGLPWYARWLGWETRLRRFQEESQSALRAARESLLIGYRMSLDRLERALGERDLEALPVLGERFDPETMEVLEAAGNTGRPRGEVVEEVRRGYRWQGRLFRPALVRVSQG